MLDSAKGEMMGSLRGCVTLADKARDLIQQMWDEGEMTLLAEQSKEIDRLCCNIKRSLKEVAEANAFFKTIADQREKMVVVRHKRIFVPLQLPKVEKISTEEDILIHS